ncbi:site-specific integrase [Rhodonellum sp.]|uniref:site-specific integrase n=1 Tax=Rhodonellum sp. TaxID=2231180 RepID=UPI002717338D|nr:site-specific integrase [Rhodonellum sp.]MDO9553730.1 tyrosine-type recombinase/integrase [Rhodonellum sp.]
MAKFNFYLREKNKDGETPIILFISFNGNRFKYPTGKTVHPKFWNEPEQEVRQVKDFFEPKIFNNNLGSILKAAKKSIGNLENELGRLPTPEEIKNFIDRELERNENGDTSTTETAPTFLGLFKRFIDDSKEGIRLTSSGKRFDKRSIQKYNTVYSTLDKFGKKYNLTFETIDKNFYTKFVAYLNKEESTKNAKGEKVIIKKSYSLNNVGKYIQVIKTFLTYATENGYNHNMYFQTKQFKAHKVAGFSVYLTEDEINDLYTLELSHKPHLERVRDLFIVGCWTGLRFSDFTNIQQENIDRDFLRITTFKTGEKVIIPIHETVKEIMAKYNGKYPNSLPPAISNQKMNLYLKEIAVLAKSLKKPVNVEGIKGGFQTSTKKQKWELITTHTARRSMATNVYKSGFPAISLMKITGHKTEKSFLLYIKVTPEENAHKLLEHWNKSVLKVV